MSKFKSNIDFLKEDLDQKNEQLDSQKEYLNSNIILIDNVNSIIKFNIELIEFLNLIYNKINLFVSKSHETKTRGEVLVSLEELLIRFINLYGINNTKNWFTD